MGAKVIPAVQPAAADEELLYAAVVQILSEDLYPHKLEIVREYIQNASDAIDDWLRLTDVVQDRSEPQIKVSLQGRSLLIWDNGIGMTEEDIPKLKRIAYSEKKAGEEAGYKGIGRLAGIAVADKLKVTTTSYGDPKLHHFEFRAADMRRDISEKKKLGLQEKATPVINRHTGMWWTDIDPEDHYTLVEIRDIHESCEDDLLSPERLMEYIGDIAPVDFSPEFSHGAKISSNLAKHVPDYSPKVAYLAYPDGRKERIYKPYRDKMEIAEPNFVEIHHVSQPGKLAAYCWYTTNAEKILDKMRPTGRIFQVEGGTIEERRRFAGLVYKLFGFSIGDRTLPERTLWTTARARAPWFTGEIHIVDKQVNPTTDRSNFIESTARSTLYSQSQRLIPPRLNQYAQEVSDNRKAFQDAKTLKQKFEEYKRRVDNGGVDRADLKIIREDLEKGFKRLTDREKKCTDPEIKDFEKQTRKLGMSVKANLDDPKRHRNGSAISDIATDLQMPTKARKVFQIVMETLQQHFSKDKDEYHSIADKIYKALKRDY